LPPGAVVVAVSDGHGSRRHFRSDRGSRLAVRAACTCSVEHAEDLGRLGGARELEAFTTAVLLPAVVERWTSDVAADVERDPFTPAEDRFRANDRDAPAVAYGATLLMAVAWRHWALLAQIGDGDIVALGPGGRVSYPVPADPILDGIRTTSLCQRNAVDAFRVGVIDRSLTDLAGVLLATDGFGNAQAADPWAPAVGRDLVEMVQTRGADWVAAQLPEWVALCASAEGSADDTTVALLLGRGGP
jgi:hypothetical protein